MCSHVQLPDPKKNLTHHGSGTTLEILFHVPYILNLVFPYLLCEWDIEKRLLTWYAPTFKTLITYALERLHTVHTRNLENQY